MSTACPQGAAQLAVAPAFRPASWKRAGRKCRAEVRRQKTPMNQDRGTSALTSACAHCYNERLSGQEVTLPLYEYRCEKCGSRIEKIQKFSDAPLTVCEKCGGALARLLSAPAIQFKGTGFYITDYARKSSAGESSSTKKSTSSSSTESSSSKSKPTDSKAPVSS